MGYRQTLGNAFAFVFTTSTRLFLFNGVCVCVRVKKNPAVLLNVGDQLTCREGRKNRGTTLKRSHPHFLKASVQYTKSSPTVLLQFLRVGKTEQMM